MNHGDEEELLRMSRMNEYDSNTNVNGKRGRSRSRSRSRSASDSEDGETLTENDTTDDESDSPASPSPRKSSPLVILQLSVKLIYRHPALPRLSSTAPPPFQTSEIRTDSPLHKSARTDYNVSIPRNDSRSIDLIKRSTPWSQVSAEKDNDILWLGMIGWTSQLSSRNPFTSFLMARTKCVV